MESRVAVVVVVVIETEYSHAIECCVTLVDLLVEEAKYPLENEYCMILAVVEPAAVAWAGLVAVNVVAMKIVIATNP